MHRVGYFHRDMKPQNIIMVMDEFDGSSLAKIADFGTAKKFRGDLCHTSNCCTTWYRAPEMWLPGTHGETYDFTVDLWAYGCVAAEVILGQPVFVVAEDEMSLMYTTIVSRIGRPPQTDGANMYLDFIPSTATLQNGGLFKDQSKARRILEIVPEEAKVVVERCLEWIPGRRGTATSLLAMPYFKNGRGAGGAASESAAASPEAACKKDRGAGDAASGSAASTPKGAGKKRQGAGDAANGSAAAKPKGAGKQQERGAEELPGLPTIAVAAAKTIKSGHPSDGALLPSKSKRKEAVDGDIAAACVKVPRGVAHLTPRKHRETFGPIGQELSATQCACNGGCCSYKHRCYGCDCRRTIT